MATFGMKEVLDVVFYDFETGEPVLFLDTLKLSNLTNSAETTYAQGGKGNGKILSWDYNRTAEFAIQDALLNPKSIAMQTGADLTKGTAIVHKREVLTVSSKGVTLKHAPIESSVFVFKTTDGVEHGEKVVPTAKAQSMTFDVGVEDGTKVIVYYQYEAEQAEQLVIKSDKFSGFYKLVGFTLARNAQTGNDEVFEVELPKVKFMSNFEINLSPEGEPAVFDMSLDVFKHENNAMVKMTRTGEEA